MKGSEKVIIFGAAKSVRGRGTGLPSSHTNKGAGSFGGGTAAVCKGDVPRSMKVEMVLGRKSRRRATTVLVLQNGVFSATAVSATRILCEVARTVSEGVALRVL